MNWKVYIIGTPGILQNPLYTTWVDKCKYPSIFVMDDPISWNPPSDAGLIISHMHFYWEYANKLWEIYQENKIPVLIMADGILDYKNTFENPQVVADHFYKPVFGHKIACIGNAQSRVLTFWGNYGKCEVVGLPRLDRFLSQKEKTASRSQDCKTILVISANTPFFTSDQEVIIRRSYRSLHKFSQQYSKIDGQKVSFKWRLHPKLKRMLQLEDDACADGDLMDELLEADAIITAPSTVYIEACLLGLPTALLDYYNAPSFLTPAWRISCDIQINKVVRELLKPARHKMQFQKEMLRDQYQMAVPAVDRLLHLIDALVQTRDRSVVSQGPLIIPENILEDGQPSDLTLMDDEVRHLMTSKDHDHQNLLNTIQALQSQLSMARLRMEAMPSEIHRLRLANARLSEMVRALQNREK